MTEAQRKGLALLVENGAAGVVSARTTEHGFIGSRVAKALVELGYATTTDQISFRVTRAGVRAHAGTPVAKQCRSCPWKVGCVPERDIPNGYRVELHEALRDTIATKACVPVGTLRAMACHYSPVGKERPCAGWLHNQLGPGNNIGVRLAVGAGTMPAPEVDGEQHETFEATLPKQRPAPAGRRSR